MFVRLGSVFSVALFALGFASVASANNRVGVLNSRGLDVAIFAQVGTASEAAELRAAFGESFEVRDEQTRATFTVNCVSSQYCVVSYRKPGVSYRQDFDELIKQFDFSLALAQDLDAEWSQTTRPMVQACNRGATDCRQFYVREFHTADGRLELRCALRVNLEGEAVGPYCSVRFDIRDIVQASRR